MVGALPIFQANQFIQLLRDVTVVPAGLATPDKHFTFDFIASAIIAVLVAVVVIGRIQRIGQLTVRLVPAMVVLYLLMTLGILVTHLSEIPAMLQLIFVDAFTGEAVAGVFIGAAIWIGVRQVHFLMRRVLVQNQWPMVRQRHRSQFVRG